MEKLYRSKGPLSPLTTSDLTPNSRFGGLRDYERYLSERHGLTLKFSTIQVAAVVVVIIVVLAATGIFTYHGTSGSVLSPSSSSVATSATQSVANQAGQGCLTTATNPYTVLGSHTPGDSSISNLQWNRFTYNAQAQNQPGTPSGQLQAQIDSPGTVTDGTVTSATKNQYALNAYDQLVQSSGTNAYEQWIWEGAITSVPYSTSTFGVINFQVSCNTPSVGIYNWGLSAILMEAPGSGTSATTNVEAVIQYPGGTTPTAYPTTLTTWYVQLQIFQAYKAGMLAVPYCGTSANPVTNYATGNTYHDCQGGAPGQNGLPTEQGYLLIASNETGLSISAPGIQTIVANRATAELLFAVPVPGCGPAPGSGVSSGSPYICDSVPVSIYETVSQGSAKGSTVFQFIDNQDLGYLKQYLTTLGATSYSSGHWSATGANSGLSRVFSSGTTPTTSPNVIQAALIEQNNVFEGTY